MNFVVLKVIHFFLFSLGQFLRRREKEREREREKRELEIGWQKHQEEEEGMESDNCKREKVSNEIERSVTTFPFFSIAILRKSAICAISGRF